MPHINSQFAADCFSAPVQSPTSKTLPSNLNRSRAPDARTTTPNRSRAPDARTTTLNSQLFTRILCPPTAKKDQILLNFSEIQQATQVRSNSIPQKP
ncbi:MAG: hypothetical protein ACRC62_10715 [Microcoleus sp.]